MPELVGSELEDFGQEVFTRMGLECTHRLNQVQLRNIRPSGPYSDEEHLEFDYLIPYGNTCLIGEITGRQTPRDVERKFSRFRRHYDIVTRSNLDEHGWQLVGVPEDRSYIFSEITEFKGFFITTRLQKFDVDLPQVPNMACFYKLDWDLLEEYSRCIGQYAQYPFLRLFDIARGAGRRELVLRGDSHALIRTPNRKIASGDIGLADLYTFEALPYELLPLAHVYRRDMLPDLSSTSGAKYQRPLIQGKLEDIRENLLVSRNFVFPNDCKIMVTAIQFKDTDAEAVQRYSAKTFIEINTNQTRVRPTHLDAIAYGILRQTYPRAIAAQIILRVNERRGRLYGLFDTNQTSLGIIQTTTVVSALKSITRLDYIRGLQGAQKGSRVRIRQGYNNLFGVTTIHELVDAEALIERGVACFERYFTLVASTFSHDWPERGDSKGSSLEYAKMMAGFVRLLRQFISEGLDWQAVETELKKIRACVMQLREIQNYDAVLFNPAHQDIPDARPSATDDYRFLNANRQRPTSIQEVVSP
jgi:hypothetical protein